MRADLVAYDKDGQLAVIVEVKNKLGTSREWAAKMRRNMYAHGLLPGARYFLLALPDRFYLWKNAGNTPETIEPNYEVDVTSLLKPYYERSGLSVDNLSGTSFELIVVSWLNELMRADAGSSVAQRNRDWLVDSGLFEAIKEGHVASEAEL